MNTLASRCCHQSTCVTTTFDPLAGVLRLKPLMSVSITSSTNAVIVSRDHLFNHQVTTRNLAMQPHSILLMHLWSRDSRDTCSIALSGPTFNRYLVREVRNRFSVIH